MAEKREKVDESVLKEKQFRDGLSLLEVYKKQIESNAREAEIVEITLNEHIRTRETLEEIKKLDKKKDELLIPIGAGIMVNVRVKDTDKAVMNVGAGVHAEDTLDNILNQLDDKIKKFEEQVTEVVSRLQQLENSATQLTQQLQSLYNDLEREGKADGL
jgi:prefoldin alpha subunit